MSQQYLTTGQAAKVCSVTPDTILKWIRSGHLPARRTAGGHHRIHREDLERIVTPASTWQRVDPIQTEVVLDRARERRHFRYCWQYYGKGKLLDGCNQCAVYLMRAQRCYEVAKLSPALPHTRTYCKKSCNDCDYFRHVNQQSTNVLVVTDDRALTAHLLQGLSETHFNLKTVDCEYACSAVVQDFRPDWAVVDCSLGQEKSRDISFHLLQDPRIPFIRVVLAGSPHEFPKECERDVFARIARPFGIQELTACIDGAVEEAEMGTCHQGLVCTGEQ